MPKTKEEIAAEAMEMLRAALNSDLFLTLTGKSLFGRYVEVYDEAKQAEAKEG